jgi:serine/threonine protein kinase
MIANRFVPIETTRAGIKARDQHTAQTVLLVDVTGFNERLVGIFHPSLITIFTCLEYEGRFLAATEFVEGRSLREVFQGEPCHPKRAAQIVSELADGVAELHSLDLTHGNISESSALLTIKGKARLSLTSVTGGNEALDVDALKLLLSTIGGKPSDQVTNAQSAAVLAAALRS